MKKTHYHAAFMKLVCLAFITLLTFSLAAANAAEKIWTRPELPPGANPAAYPVPANDWFARVQGNFDNTMGKQFDLIFDGDSITDAWRGRGKEFWDKLYVPLNAYDFAIGGDRTEHVLWRLKKGQVDGLNPKLIVLMIGTNNLARHTSDQVLEGITAVVKEYLERCPNAHLLLLGIFPRNATSTDPTRIRIGEINAKLALLDDGNRITFMDIGEKFLTPDGKLTTDMMPDLLHPSTKGYEIWAEAIQPVIDKYFPPAKN